MLGIRVGEKLGKNSFIQDFFISHPLALCKRTKIKRAMYKINNNVEDKIIFEGTERDFIEFMQKIAIENKDFDFSILGISDALEYLEDYCDNLDLEEE